MARMHLLPLRPIDEEEERRRRCKAAEPPQPREHPNLLLRQPTKGAPPTRRRRPTPTPTPHKAAQSEREGCWLSAAPGFCCRCTAALPQAACRMAAWCHAS